MDEEITQEEIAAFYALAKKMNKLNGQLRGIQPGVTKYIDSETQPEYKPSLLRIAIKMDLIKEGAKMNMSEELLSIVNTIYEIPIDSQTDTELLVNKILNKVSTTLQNIMRNNNDRNI